MPLSVLLTISILILNDKLYCVIIRGEATFSPGVILGRITYSFGSDSVCKYFASSDSPGH